MRPNQFNRENQPRVTLRLNKTLKREFKDTVYHKEDSIQNVLESMVKNYVEIHK